MRTDFEETYPPTVEAPRRARHALSSFLSQRGLDAMVPDAALLLSELVANVVCHVPSEIDVRAGIEDETLRVEVYDGSPTLPYLRPSDIGGHGLRIVETLSEAWGSAPVDGPGKVTWFELRVEHGRETLCSGG